MAVAINYVSLSQTKGTKLTMKDLMYLLSYASTLPDAKIWNHASGIILHIHRDGSHMSVPKTRSRAGGYFFSPDSLHNPAKRG